MTSDAGALLLQAGFPGPCRRQGRGAEQRSWDQIDDMEREQAHTQGAYGDGQ